MTFDSPAGLAVLGAAVIPALLLVVLSQGERMLRLVPASARGRIRPWYWLTLPLALVAVVIVYPLIATLIYAFFDGQGSEYVGLDNFRWAGKGDMVDVLKNTAIWLVAFPIVTLLLALCASVLFDKIRYERVAMTIIVLPTAISFTAASVIWRQVYGYAPPGTPQRGVLNQVWTQLGGEPKPWLQQPVVNTLCLIFVAVWALLGIATLILSAAVKNVPTELVEAARLDGAGELRIFWHIVLPSISTALLVVLTTQVIFALKIFDVVYVMTNGNYNTDTIANRMYFELFSANNLGHASAMAVLLLVVALPVVLVHIRQFRAESQFS